MDLAQGVLVLVSIFLSMIFMQIYLGGWGCAGGKIQKGEYSPRRSGTNSGIKQSSFGAIMLDRNIVNEQDHSDSESNVPPASPSLDHSCSIEMVEFDNLPSVDEDDEDPVDCAPVPNSDSCSFAADADAAETAF